jgi:hypothetical protein
MCSIVMLPKQAVTDWRKSILMQKYKLRYAGDIIGLIKRSP